MTKKTVFFFYILFFIASIQTVKSQQIVEQPNNGRASHPTLTLNRVIISDQETIFMLTIENRISNGNFCTDKNIYIQASTGGEKYPLIKSEGIPTCPDSHIFKTIGEQLQFRLVFPPIPPNTKFIDLVEDCNNACFFIKGIILDEEVNVKINNAYVSYLENNKTKAGLIFDELINQYPNYPYGIWQYNLAKIYNETNQKEQFKKLYKSIKYSKLKDKETIVEQIKSPEFSR